jgi:hypothetical protein
MITGDTVTIKSRSKRPLCPKCISHNGDKCCIGFKGRILEVGDSYAIVEVKTHKNPYAHSIRLNCWFEKSDLEVEDG